MEQDKGRRSYTYGFKKHVNIDDIQDTLTLAIFGAETLHGRSQVRLDGWWRLDRQRRICVIDATTEVGQDINRLFTGYLATEFGDSSFRMLRDKREHPSRKGEVA